MVLEVSERDGSRPDLFGIADAGAFISGTGFLSGFIPLRSARFRFNSGFPGGRLW
jgi:hypothetical protein